MPENTSNGVAIGSLERAEGELQGSDRAQAGVPDPELIERPRRRRFTAEYKLQILREVDACAKPGEVGVLLRREGLYSSLLTEWRRARDSGALRALERPRGRPKADPRDAQMAALRRRAERAEAELGKARHVIEVRGNVSALLWRVARAQGRAGERRAMIEQTVDDLATIIGTRPACRALGARRRRSTAADGHPCRDRRGPGRRHRGHCQGRARRRARRVALRALRRLRTRAGVGDAAG